MYMIKRIYIIKRMFIVNSKNIRDPDNLYFMSIDFLNSNSYKYIDNLKHMHSLEIGLSKLIS